MEVAEKCVGCVTEDAIEQIRKAIEMRVAFAVPQVLRHVSDARDVVRSHAQRVMEVAGSKFSLSLKLTSTKSFSREFFLF